jgi:ribosomal protein S6--L-glutamate ligase
MRIVVLAHSDSWHFQELKRAASGRHAIQRADFSSARVNSPVAIGDRSVFECETVSINEADCLLTRTIPAGSLEQIVFRMDWLFQIESQLGIPVINSAKCVEASVDKYLSLEKIRHAGIRVPETRVCQTLTDAMQQFEEFGCDTVVKPIFGSQGRGIVRLRNRQAAELLFQQRLAEGQVVYQQQFIEHGESDLRLLVIGQKVIAMSRYRQGHWVTNASQGATCTAHTPTQVEMEIALDTAGAVGALVAGVDIVFESESRQPYVVEVNSCPAWKSMATVSAVNIASEIIQLVELQVAANREKRHSGFLEKPPRIKS